MQLSLNTHLAEPRSRYSDHSDRQPCLPKSAIADTELVSFYHHCIILMISTIDPSKSVLGFQSERLRRGRLPAQIPGCVGLCRRSRFFLELPWQDAITCIPRLLKCWMRRPQLRLKCCALRWLLAYLRARWILPKVPLPCTDIEKFNSR